MGKSGWHLLVETVCWGGAEGFVGARVKGGLRQEMLFREPRLDAQRVTTG